MLKLNSFAQLVILTQFYSIISLLKVSFELSVKDTAIGTTGLPLTSGTNMCIYIKFASL